MRKLAGQKNTLTFSLLGLHNSFKPYELILDVKFNTQPMDVHQDNDSPLGLSSQVEFSTKECLAQDLNANFVILMQETEL